MLRAVSLKGTSLFSGQIVWSRQCPLKTGSTVHILITAVSEMGQPMVGCRNHKGDVTTVIEV